jgi:hypothetical protein
MEQFSERRLKENEVIFQQANKGVADFVMEDGGDDETLIGFYCECSNIDCRERILLNASDYRRYHKDQRHFIALKGHEMPNIENVVDEHDNFVIVRKVGEIPSVKDIDRVLPDLAAGM